MMRLVSKEMIGLSFMAIGALINIYSQFSNEIGVNPYEIILAILDISFVSYAIFLYRKK